MFTFFRRIRKRLLDIGATRPNGSSGRASKYLLYAIGEILLVMIGILLALQVNIWNEHKKLVDKTNTYRGNLTAELQSDLSKIEEIEREAIKDIVTIENYIDYYNLDNPLPAILVQKMDSIEYDLIRFITKTYTIDEIISTGNLSLFKEKEKSAILSLRATHLQKEDSYSQGIRDLMDYTNAVNEQIDVLHLYGYSGKEHPEIANWKYNLKSHQLRLYNNEIAAVLYFFDTQKFNLQEIRNKTTKLVDILNESQL